MLKFYVNKTIFHIILSNRFVKLQSIIKYMHPHNLRFRDQLAIIRALVKLLHTIDKWSLP